MLVVLSAIGLPKTSWRRGVARFVAVCSSQPENKGDSIRCLPTSLRNSIPVRTCDMCPESQALKTNYKGIDSETLDSTNSNLSSYRQSGLK